MRHTLMWLLLGFAGGCAVRYPAVVPMREQEFRSHDEAVALPLNQDARSQVASFLEHGGNRFGRNATPDAQAAGHQQILDALGVGDNLDRKSTRLNSSHLGHLVC